MRIQSIRNRLLKFTVLIPAILALSSGCAVKNEEILEPAADVSRETTSEQVRKLIQREIKDAGTPPRISFGGKFIYASTMLPRFYERNNYRPVWSDDNGLLPQADAFVTIISNANKEGLNPADYHLPEINVALSEIHQGEVVTASNYQTYGEPLSPYGLSKADLLLTDALLKYSSHLLNGRIHPEVVDTAWMIRHREMDLTDVLRSAVETNQIEENLKRLLPENPVYSRLKDALAQYQQIAERGGWPMVPEGSKMEKGHRGDREDKRGDTPTSCSCPPHRLRGFERRISAGRILRFIRQQFGRSCAPISKTPRTQARRRRWSLYPGRPERAGSKTHKSNRAKHGALALDSSKPGQAVHPG